MITETSARAPQPETQPHGWRTIIVGLPTIRRLLNGEDVEIETFKVNLIPDDVLWNNKEDVAVLLGEDVMVMERIFKARALLGGKVDERSIFVARRRLPQKKGGAG
jgi:hypothetical protein